LPNWPYLLLAAQVDTAGWFDCAPASPLISRSTGHDALRVQVGGRPISATAFGTCFPPQSKGSPCQIPKPAMAPAAAAVLRSLQRTPVPLILARMKVCWFTKPSECVCFVLSCMRCLLPAPKGASGKLAVSALALHASELKPRELRSCTPGSRKASICSSVSWQSRAKVHPCMCLSCIASRCCWKG
jgi:hypothetical protein